MQTSGYRYFLEPPTRPQTIGYALTDAPAAPAAWMLDHDTDAYCKISRAFLDGQPSDRLTWHSILDNITLYWLTGTGATAAMVRDYQVWHHPSDGLPGPSGSSTREDETVMIFLKQAPYKCLEHQIDLTGQVREKLQGSGLWTVDPTGQSLRRTLTVAVVRSLRRRRSPDTGTYQ